MKIEMVTTGARSGMARPVTLYAWEDEDRLVVVGSKGGSARHPAWVHNLRTHPSVSVKRGRELIEMTAREVIADAERDRLWKLVVERFALYATYQARTGRLIPLFVLEPG